VILEIFQANMDMVIQKKRTVSKDTNPVVKKQEQGMAVKAQKEMSIMTTTCQPYF